MRGEESAVGVRVRFVPVEGPVHDGAGGDEGARVDEQEQAPDEVQDSQHQTCDGCCGELEMLEGQRVLLFGRCLLRVEGKGEKQPEIHEKNGGSHQHKGHYQQPDIIFEELVGVVDIINSDVDPFLVVAKHQ